MTKPPIVLVHGAFHGGWCWKPVARMLRTAGHEVYTPSQTGLGDRSHLMSATIDLETFVLDILHLVESEELEEAILVGHSFGTRSVCGVADRIPQRIKQLIVIDGAFALDNSSRLDSMPEEARNQRIAAAMANDGGISVPTPPAASFGITDPRVAAWVDRQLTPQPLGAERTSVVLANPIGNGLPLSYLRCTDPAFPAVEPSAAYARAQTAWRYQEIAACHDVIVTHPKEIADYIVAEDAATR